MRVALRTGVLPCAFRALTMVIVLGQPALGYGRAVSVDEARRLAEETSPEIKAAQARVEQARGRKTTAQALLPNPEIEAAIETDRLTGNEGEGTYELAFRQELPIFGTRGLRISVADAELAVLTLEVEAARLSVRRDVTRAYYELMFEERRATALAAALEQAERIADAGARRVQAGDIADAEYSLILADRAEARAQAATARADRRETQARLNALVGNPAGEDVETTGDFPAPAEPAAFASLVKSARARRPDLVAAQREVLARGREVDLARRERVPVPVLEVGYTNERSEFPRESFAPGAILDEFDRDHLLGVRLSIALPVFATGRGAVTEARGRRAEAEARREGLTRAVDAEVDAALARYAASREQAAEYGDVEPRLTETLAQYERAFAAGQTDLTDFLAIRDRILGARLRALEARRDAAIAAAELEVVVGGSFAGGDP